MLKLSTTLFTIFALVTVTMNAPTLAQSQTAPQASDSAAAFAEKPVNAGPTAEQSAVLKPDLKKVFADETRKFNETSAEFDPIKVDQQQTQQQAKSKRTKKDKFLIAAAIVGGAGLVFLLIKYGRVCIRTNQANCTSRVDEFCTCKEFEQSN